MCLERVTKEYDKSEPNETFIGYKVMEKVYLSYRNYAFTPPIQGLSYQSKTIGVEFPEANPGRERSIPAGNPRVISNMYRVSIPPKYPETNIQRYAIGYHILTTIEDAKRFLNIIISWGSWPSQQLVVVKVSYRDRIVEGIQERMKTVVAQYFTILEEIE